MRINLMLRLEERLRGTPRAREQRMGARTLELAVLVAAEAREEMEPLLGARCGDVEKARGLGVFGFGVEAGEVSVGRVGFEAGRFDGSQKQASGAAAFAGATRRSDHFMKQKQVRVASS